jgi:predicted DCC family thiol-disulfide oxidoreductase YuxK
MQKKQTVEIVYDGKCPVCTAYCTNIKPDNETELVLIDARKPSPLMDEITAKGLDIDEGMVVRINNGDLHYGSDAIHALSKISGKPGWVRTINRFFFSSEKLASVFYPFGKFIRNRVLDILRIKRIRNLKSDKSDSR